MVKKKKLTGQSLGQPAKTHQFRHWSVMTDPNGDSGNFDLFIHKQAQLDKYQVFDSESKKRAD